MRLRIKTLLPKISLSIISFLFFLSILEVGLRVAGYLIYRERISASYRQDLLNPQDNRRFGHGIRQTERGDYPNEESPREKVYTILCVGDSYTFGGHSDFDRTYPALLQKKLNSLGLNTHFVVINGGSCEYNSSQVLRRLPVLVKDYDPDAVMLLVGAANSFNFALYNENINPFVEFIRNLRVYKMFRIVKLNLEKKVYPLFIKSKKVYDPQLIGADGYELCKPRWDKMRIYIESMSSLDSFNSLYEEVWYLHNKGRIREALRLCTDYLEDNPNDERLLCLYGYLTYKRGDIKKAEEIFQNVYELYPDSEQTMSWLSYFYNSLGRSGDPKYWNDVRIFCMALKFDPYYDLHTYYNLAHSYDLQSRYEASYVVDFLEEMLRDDPGLKKHHMFCSYYEYFRNQQEWSEKVKQWLRRDLEKIVRFCKDKGLELIIQNYPYNYPMANRILKELARKYSLSFIDHNSVFSNLVESSGIKGKYFADDNHCTDRGHEVMVENIVGSLLNEGIVR
ncbi:MAG: hypothetical protein GF375_06920 [Candidatus Omnitrophica bacterium]|nr:hypothetical protein [Candidatus Omnitrophota bacterium]MBD3269708.1 hypothetical protein [Candidatus Omnitrophota bacterium]